MSVTIKELADFTRFAAGKLDEGATDSIADLAHRWHTARERAQTNAALSEAIDQMNAGQARPLDEVFRELRQRLDLPVAGCDIS